MIEVLDSLKYKTTTNLFDIGVSSNNFTLPTYTQSIIDGRYKYSNSYTPKYLEGVTNYNVDNQTSNKDTIRSYIDLKSSYNPTELIIDYIGTTIYNKLNSFDIQYYLYWYDVVNCRSTYTVQQELTSKSLYSTFSDSVGTLMLYTPTPETIYPTDLNTAKIQPYNRTIEPLIPENIKTLLSQSYNDVNSPYAENIINITNNSASSTSHGSHLVVDKNNNTRYTSISTNYINDLVSNYKQLMYISPLYAIMDGTVTFNQSPYYTSTICGSSVVVDKLGNKVSITQGWSELITLSAYPES